MEYTYVLKILSRAIVNIDWALSIMRVGHSAFQRHFERNRLTCGSMEPFVLKLKNKTKIYVCNKMHSTKENWSYTFPPTQGCSPSKNPYTNNFIVDKNINILPYWTSSFQRDVTMCRIYCFPDSIIMQKRLDTTKPQNTR